LKQSLWFEQDSSFTVPSLQQHENCEICIIGGGLSGIYTAYLLAKQGFHVVLVEALPQIGHGTTAFSTGKLTAQHGEIYSKLSIEQGKLYYETNKKAIENALETNPPSFTRSSSFLYTQTTQGKKQLEQEAEIYKKIGIPSITTKEIELNIPIQLALGMENEGQINPLAFAQHFAQLARKYGAQLFTNTRITQMQPNKNAVITDNGYTIQYKKLILSTHYPIESLRQLYSVKLQVNRSYLTATKCSQLLQHQYFSIDEKSHTIRTALIEHQPYFIYGAYGHSAGTIENTETYYETLQNELHEYFELPAPSYCWSAQDMMTSDQLPYIGQLSKNDDSLYIATGFNKWGLSSSLVAGEILTNLIQKIMPPAAELYLPTRSLLGRQIYFMLQTGGFVSKELVKGYVTRSHTPRCTHLGCKTRWNEADQTWDCPCHGSRYNEKGQVVEGPAVYPLNLKKSGDSKN
jgi:glycine/D-amino acid oxidase-like deaminating enzyme